MKKVDEQSIKMQIEYLKLYTEKSIKNLKSLHQREKEKKLHFLSNFYSDIFLDLYQLRNFNIDYDTDPLFLQMAIIRENFYKLIH